MSIGKSHGGGKKQTRTSWEFTGMSCWYLGSMEKHHPHIRFGPWRAVSLWLWVLHVRALGVYVQFMHHSSVHSRQGSLSCHALECFGGHNLAGGTRRSGRGVMARGMEGTWTNSEGPSHLHQSNPCFTLAFSNNVPCTGSRWFGRRNLTKKNGQK